jgi:hypothetical protein
MLSRKSYLLLCALLDKGQHCLEDQECSQGIGPKDGPELILISRTSNLSFRPQSLPSFTMQGARKSNLPNVKVPVGKLVVYRSMPCIQYTNAFCEENTHCSEDRAMVPETPALLMSTSTPSGYALLMEAAAA